MGKKSNKNKIQIKQNKGNINFKKYKHKKSMKPTAFKNKYMYIYFTCNNKLINII